MSRRRTKRAERKKQEPIDSVTVLKMKLREKLRIAKLQRLSQFSRDQILNDLEEKLEDARGAKVRGKLQKEIEILNRIQENQDNTTINDDFPQYTDSM